MKRSCVRGRGSTTASDVSLAAIAAVAALTGCVAQSGFGRATTLAPRAARAAAFTELAVAGLRLLPDEDVALPGAQLGGGFAYGIAEGVELGARVWGVYTPNFLTSFGGSLDSKWQLSRGKIDVALASSVGYHQLTLGGAPWHTFHATLPLLFGWNLGRHQLVFGPRVADYLLTAYGQNTVNSFWGGLSLGFAWRVSERIDLLPELVILYSPVNFGGRVDPDDRRGATLTTLGLGATLDL